MGKPMPKTLPFQGPRPRRAHQPKGDQFNMRQTDWQISFDKEQFTKVVNSYGVRMLHQRAIPNPIGMASRGDNRAVQEAQRSDDEFIYEDAGVVTAFFSNNSGHSTTPAIGALDHAIAYITLPDTYDKSKTPVLVSTWDRFYLQDVEVRVVKKQYVQYNNTGIDRLQFPATFVEHLIDARGIRYIQGEDFELTPDGAIKWIGQKRPGWNPQLGQGEVYAIRYRYTPYFIVNRLIHEIRVSQITNPATFERSLERMPYQVEVFREHVYKDVNRDPGNNSADIRFQDAPSSGGNLGPQ